MMRPTYRPTTAIALFFALFLALAWPPGSTAREGPEQVELAVLQFLYQPVLFDHASHSEMYACNVCHHHTTGDGPAEPRCARCHQHSPAYEQVACSSCHRPHWPAGADLPQPAGSAAAPEYPAYHIDVPLLKGALHLQCLGCHQAESGPTGCEECHPYTPEGRARFAEGAAAVTGEEKPQPRRQP
jgi:hypothetical protein